MSEVLEGDCVEVMAGFSECSVDAIVCDPPYGLEFMGKGWDRLGDIGRTSHAGPSERDGSTVFGRQRISYSGSSNRRCRTCQKWEWDYPERKCRCDKPDFPNVRAHQGRLMEDWHHRWATEALRVAKPGAHLLAFGGTRTYHRLVCAIEDAGWEIRDCLVWAYASGFPKSLDVSKAIDKRAGVERPVIRERDWHDPMDTPFRTHYGGEGPDGQPVVSVTGPGSPDAETWQGWGTALKPAWEPIVLARKPLHGSVVANVLEHGTGALNIDGTRIAMGPADAAAIDGMGGFGLPEAPRRTPATTVDFGQGTETRGAGAQAHDLGRWPANVILTDPIFDGDTEGVVGGGETSSGSRAGEYEAGGFLSGSGPVSATLVGDSGTYSRFFLIPKADRAEREPFGLDDFEARREQAHRKTGPMDTPYLRGETMRRNTHPTVKPVELMRHLIRLVTPSGGVVLDPFLGSGTTAIAAEMEGFGWIGIEKEPEYIAIARARLLGTQRGLGLVG